MREMGESFLGRREDLRGLSFYFRQGIVQCMYRYFPLNPNSKSKNRSIQANFELSGLINT